jgi:hypothetical protein
MSCHAAGGDFTAEFSIKLKGAKIDHAIRKADDGLRVARVTMTSGEFTRIVRPLSTLCAYVTIKVSEEGVLFETDGEDPRGKFFLKLEAVTTQPKVAVGRKSK